MKNQMSRRYSEYLSEKLWQPLHASDSSLWLDHEGGMTKAYCCIFATPRDWMRIGERPEKWDGSVLPNLIVDGMSSARSR